MVTWSNLFGRITLINFELSVIKPNIPRLVLSVEY